MTDSPDRPRVQASNRFDGMSAVASPPLPGGAWREDIKAMIYQDLAELCEGNSAQAIQCQIVLIADMIEELWFRTGQVGVAMLNRRLAEYFARKGGTNTGFLSGLYLDALGRPLDPVGLAAWGGALDAGLNRAFANLPPHYQWLRNWDYV